MNRKVDTAYFLNDPRKFDSVEQAEKELNRLRAVCIRLSREEKIAGLESITVKPDGTLAFKFKGIEEVDRLVEKHKYLKYQTRNKVS